MFDFCILMEISNLDKDKRDENPNILLSCSFFCHRHGRMCIVQGHHRKVVFTHRLSMFVVDSLTAALKATFTVFPLSSIFFY